MLTSTECSKNHSFLNNLLDNEKSEPPSLPSSIPLQASPISHREQKEN